MKRRRWTEADAIAALQAHAGRVGRSATCRELHPPLPTQGTLERLFGSVNAAQVAAGLAPRAVGRPAMSEKRSD